MQRILDVIIAALIFLLSQSAIGQTQTQSKETQSIQPALPSFEVASILPSGPNLRVIDGLYTYPGGRIVASGCTLNFLIRIAFNVQDFQISGGPHWTEDADGDRFDIQAKPPDSSLSAQWKTGSPKIPPGDEEREMLQSLLADRFHLAFHREVKDGPIFILSRGSGDLKLTPSKDDNGFPWAGGVGNGLPSGDGIRGNNISMPQFAARLSSWLGRPVIDETGIHGSFDFEFHSGVDDTNSSIDTTVSILTSIKGIGLILRSSRGPVETIVIDHVEHPSAN